MRDVICANPNCKETFKTNRRRQQWCAKEECQEKRKAKWRADNRGRWKKYYKNHKAEIIRKHKAEGIEVLTHKGRNHDKTKIKKRLCRGYGHMVHCKKYIDNENRLFCSYCHRYYSDRLPHCDEVMGGGFDNYPVSEQPCLAGEGNNISKRIGSR